MRRRSMGYQSPIPVELKQANAKMALGDYSSAAYHYEALLREPNAENTKKRAFFSIMAGRARILTGQTSTGLAHLKRGLMRLAEGSHHIQLYRIGLRIAEELRQRNLLKEAAEISALVNANIPATAELPTEHSSHSAPRLPAACAVCGGPLRSDEVEWLTPRQAECPFCNTPVNAL